PQARLPGGGAVTLEPGGQLEISTPPSTSLAGLYRDAEADIGRLADLLAARGLHLGARGMDPHRPPRPFLVTPRYAAMAAYFDRQGPHGQVMMRCTAGLQVCLDAGPPAEAPARWCALHLVGPPLLAAFANSRRQAGRDSGCASARMATWLAVDPARTRPVWPAADRRAPGTAGSPVPGDPGTEAARRPYPDPTAARVDPAAARVDPAADWARYALAAPLLCVRRPDGPWDAPPGVTFADWVAGALPTPPTVEDLDCHLRTLFPPVRPRGYLEVRYLDAQPPGEWIAPVAVLAALLADPATVAAVERICAPTADAWPVAARAGLADPVVAAVAAEVLDLAVRRLDRTDLSPAVRRLVTDIVARRLAGGREADA
ncbi:MAG TPA: glutamate-cysteine ligase family protein, partial [Pilimelia sp.]|nr:glutamate-cysteine ligase family protein [Pilimelia sp.]